MSLLLNSFCFICGVRTGLLVKNNRDRPEDNINFRSGKKLHEVLSEVVGFKIEESNQDASTLCKKCSKSCTEYDAMQVRCQELKDELKKQFTIKSMAVKKEMLPAKERKPLVLSASKLKPLPPQYIIMDRNKVNMGKFLSLSSTMNVAENETKQPAKVIQKSLLTPQLSIKNTPKDKDKINLDESLLLSPSKSTDKCSLVEEIASISDITASDTNTTTIFTTMLNTSPTNSILSFDLNKLTKNILENAVSCKVEDAGSEDDEVKTGGVENGDEQPMEIDEDCTASKNDADAILAEVLENTNKEDDTVKGDNHFDIIPELETIDDDFVVRKVEIVTNDDDADENGDSTILMEDENGALIRVSGQKFLIIPQEDTDDVDDGTVQDHSQDSNDVPQIEFQVSGDEETANAIIAAAKEEGGAFIEVQSGAMYKVESVKSKLDNEEEITFTLDNVAFEKDGAEYKCLRCENIVNSEKMNPEKSPKTKVFTTTDGVALVKHMKLVHNTVLYSCPFCEEILQKSEYNKHMALHGDFTLETVTSSKKSHECGLCKKKFGSRSLLQEHMNQHAGTRPYSCNICGKTFASKYTHQSHMKTHQNRPRPFKCVQCGKSFFTQQNLAQHERTHFGVKDHVCKDCGKAFGTAHNLSVHGVVHSRVKPFLCGLCGKPFARKAEIRDHLRTHTGERPFVCSLCPARFSQRSNLQSHVRATHMQDKRHACPHCEKRFKRRRLLDYHIKASHTGERPYRCEICKTTFVYPEHYKKHARIHSGEKPFVCEVCGKSFNSRDNRNAHRFVHSDKKPYECLVCGAGYMRKPLLYAHMNTSGHMTESIVVNQPRVTQELESETIFDAIQESELQLTDASAVASQDDAAAKVYITTDGEKKIIFQDGKSTLNLMQHSDDPNLIKLAQTLVESNEKIDASILESISTEDLEKSAQILANDETGGTLRLVQIQLPNGGNGWVAIN